MKLFKKISYISGAYFISSKTKEIQTEKISYILGNETF